MVRPDDAARVRAVVLLSGGLDSATALAIARAEGRECHALSFRYGQRHAVELAAAARIGGAFGVASHRVVDLDLAALGGSALTGSAEVPKRRDHAAIAGAGIPITYVPARNAIFLSYALAVAEVIDAGEIVIGVNVLDSSGYPDCRPAFVEAMGQVARVGTKAGAEGHPAVIRAPLISWNKAEIIKRGVSLGVDYSLTHSCYDPDPDGGACGGCDACALRRKGFQEAGVPDPTRYASS